MFIESYSLCFKSFSEVLMSADDDILIDASLIGIKYLTKLSIMYFFY